MATAAETFAQAARCHAEGNISLAEQHAWSVLRTDPAHADALYMLGVIAWQKGTRSAAINFLQRSVDSNGTNAAAWKNLADMQVAMGDYKAGVVHYEQALRLRPNFVVAHDLLGIALQHLGEWDRAVHCHRQAINLVPSLAPAHNNLGNALKGQGKWAEALEAFEQAHRLEPDRPEFAFNLGVTLHEQGNLDRAVGFYREALRLRPAYPDASNNLATAYKELGLLDDAITQFQETLKLQPDHALAYYNLGKFAAEGRYQFAPEELERVKGFMASERCTPPERSLYCFALATVLDKQGSYGEAFGYYRQANDLKKRILQEQNIVFDPSRHQALIDRIIAVHDDAYFKAVKGWGVGSDMPVFIVGMPRSGSTLVEQILASHPHVFGAGEIGDVPRFIIRLATHAGPSLYETPVLIDKAVAQARAADFLERLARLGEGAARVTIKTLDNFLHLGLIATLLPTARIIHCRRDPLDVCLSCYFQNFQSDFAWSLEDIGTYYRAYERLMDYWSEALPVHIHEVRYEELIHNQEAISRELLGYCGLDWDDRCLSFFKTRRVVQTASAVQVRKPVSAKAIGRWRHYRAHLGPLLQALGGSIDAD
jgi:tetratricopeptide (TPR) repeat protein